MKAICLFLTLLLPGFFAFSQNFHFPKPESSNTSSFTASEQQTNNSFHLVEYQFYWDDNLQSWDSSRYIQYLRNPNGSVSQSIEQKMQLGGFENFVKDDYQYNNNGSLLVRNTAMWDGNAWENNSQLTWHFDQNGIDTLKLNFSWNGSSWDTVGGYLKILEYDANNLLTSEIFHLWHADSSFLVPYNKITTSYKQNLEKDSVVSYFRSNNSWEALDLSIYVSWFNHASNQAEHIINQTYNGNFYVNNFQSWYLYGSNGSYMVDLDDWNLNHWEASLYKKVVDFDSMGNVTLEERSEKIGLNYIPYDGKRWFHQYTPNGDLAETIYQEYWTPTGSYRNQTKYVYLDFVTQSPEAVVSEDWVRLYPQPSAGWTNLAIRHAESGPVDLKIYDLQGKLVYADRLRHPGGQFEWALPTDWTPGMYLLRLDLRGKSVTKKLILK